MRIHNISYFYSNPFYLNNNINYAVIAKKFEMIINILLILTFIWFFLFVKLVIIKENIKNPFLYLRGEKYLEKEKKCFNSNFIDKNILGKDIINNNNKTLRELTTFFQGKYTKEDFIKRRQLKNILNQLTKTEYIGKWFTKEEEEKKLLIGDSIEGFTKIKFSQATELTTREEAFAILINNYEDKYINHWLYHTSFILDRNIYLKTDKNNSKLYFIGKWETKVEYGELFFTKISRRYPCGSNVTITFPLKNITLYTNLSNGESFIETIDTIDNSNFNISFNSSCGFNMSMEIYPEDEKRVNGIKYEVNKYTIILFIIIILNMLSIFLMTRDLKKNNEALSCISLFSLIQNLNWHVYCCMTHLTWSITNNKFFFQFNTIAFLYIFNIVGFDFIFIYNYWKIIKEHVSNRKLINLKVSFYFSFYFFFFISFFIITDLMIYYPLILISSILMWTPQVLHNIIYYNNYIYPFFYAIISSVERLYFAFYFRAYDNNFYKIRGNKIFIYIIIIYIIFIFIILFLQMLFGPRFFLPKKYKKINFNFYKTKEELLQISEDISSNECVICLLPIFNESGEELDQSNDKKGGGIEINNSESIDTSRNEINKNKDKNLNLEENSLKQKKSKVNKKGNYIRKIYCHNIWFFIKNIFEVLLFKGFYRFYRIPKNPENKEFMRTPCKHVFHTVCLEKWFVMKKECPNCRCDLKDKIY